MDEREDRHTMDTSPIIIGSDHAAFALKEHVKRCLGDLGLEVKDIGPFNEESVDYPDYGALVARSVSNGLFRRGILLCGTGLGMSMVANRFPGVRAALCNDLFSAIMARKHNDANILVMGGRVVGDALATEVVMAWLKTPFDGGRHQARIEKIEHAAGRDDCSASVIPDARKGEEFVGP